MKTNTLTPDLLRKIDAYWRAANYLSVGQIYLYDNPLLKRPLTLIGGMGEVRGGVDIDVSDEGAFETWSLKLDGRYGLKDHIEIKNELEFNDDRFFVITYGQNVTILNFSFDLILLRFEKMFQG